MRAYERLLNYVKINTTSDESNESCPSSKEQFVLANELVKELKSMGVNNAHVDENCYVYAKIPAKGSVKGKIGFISHMDTSPACPGGPIKPFIIENYDGSDIHLKNGIIIENKEFDFLKNLVGNDIIVTDGKTLLGADDKSGIAIIMTLVEHMMRDDAPDHCEISIGFTPDEEIGRGADLFDVVKFDADFAFTVDGGALGEIEYENFNAASAIVEINGINIHPGSAKNKMKNAARIAAKFDGLLPESERPEYTEGYEGFYHLCEINATEEYAKLIYIIRDHDMQKFEEKKKAFQSIVDFCNSIYGPETIKVSIKDSYYNMKDKIMQKPEIIELAKKSFIESGVEYNIIPIRGGTDGSRLSYMGLLCPNLSTGGYNFHSRKELVSINSMDKMVEVLTNIVKSN